MPTRLQDPSSATGQDRLLRSRYFIPGATMLGFLAAGWLAYLLLTRPAGAWQPFPAPPLPPSRLITANEQDELFLASGADHIYICSRSDSCREIGPESVLASGVLCPPLDRVEPPPPPGAPQHDLEIHLCDAMASIQQNFVLTADGALWHWSHRTGWREGLLALLAAYAGAAVAIALAIALRLWFNREGNEPGYDAPP